MRQALVALALLAAAPALAGEIPKPGALDARVRSVNYSEWQVYAITTTLRAVMTVEIAAEEQISKVAIGDTVSWEVGASGNLLYIKQREEAAGTNAVITALLPDGKQRTYQLELTPSKGEPQMVKVKFLYPGQEAAKRREEQTRENQAALSREVASGIFTGPQNFKYSMAGVASFQPADAWDNGQVTVFRFAGQTEVPAIFAVSTEGEERTVQVSQQGELAVVATVAPMWRLRIGDAVVCIYNEAYDPANAPSGGSGTVGTSFFRQLKVQP